VTLLVEIQFNLRPACDYCNENKRQLDVRRRLFLNARSLPARKILTDH